MDEVGECPESSTGDVGPAVALFPSLSDATRPAIIARWARGETRVADRAGELTQSTASAHVGCLRDCGLVTGRARGRQVFSSPARPEPLAVPAAAETLLAASGGAVALCPNYGTGGGGKAPEMASGGPAPGAGVEGRR